MTGVLRDFAARAAGAGDEPALSCAREVWSAREFWDAVHFRAGQLRASGVERGDRVTIALRKGPEAVAWLFASLLCGAIAVPLDRRAPASRLTALLADLDPAAALFDAPTLARFESSGGRLPGAGQLILSEPPAIPSDSEVDRFAGPPLAAEDPAMILMTSGTTGDPKGIVLSHGNIAAFSDWALEVFGLGRGDRFLNIAPLHFDLSLLDILTGLRIGAQVVLAEEGDALFPARLCQLAEEHRISVLYTVPTILQAMVARGGLATRALPGLRWVLFAGEVYPPPALARLIAAVPQARFANLFGPTETNVIAWTEVEHAPATVEAPNIGSACAHSRIEICDAQGAPVGPGETGEICVAGPTVMLGYWNQPELTRERYFAGRNDIFRTGDFGFRDAAGDIRFVGRQDRQAKLRGHRVELGAIEVRALALDGVAAAAATVCDAGQSLCLHVAAQPEATLSQAGLRRALSLVLPPHEVPSCFIFYEDWPTTSSGKCDMARLDANHRSLLYDQGETS